MPDHADPWLTAVAALRLGNRVIDEIQAGVIAAGFDDVTPLHGFAFARIAAGVRAPRTWPHTLVSASRPPRS
jgi:hypothetical protein